jgi:hypothetical protein
MQAAFVVYFISQLNTWHESLNSAMYTVLVAAILGNVIWYLIIKAGEAPVRKWHIILPTVIVVICGVLSAALPSQKTAEYMATAYGVQYAIQSPTGQQVLDKSGKIVNNVLDLAIQKTTPTPIPIVTK